MEESREILLDEDLAAAAEPVREAEALPQASSGVDLKDILDRIDRILDDTSYIKNAISTIQNMPVNSSVNGGLGDQAKAEAVGNAVAAREATNQQIIRFLEKMYDDITPRQAAASGEPQPMQQFQMLKDSLRDYPPELSKNLLRSAVEQIFSKSGL